MNILEMTMRHRLISFSSSNFVIECIHQRLWVMIRFIIFFSDISVLCPSFLFNFFTFILDFYIIILMQEKCQVIVLLLILATLITVNRDVASGGILLPYGVMGSPQGVHKSAIPEVFSEWE